VPLYILGSSLYGASVAAAYGLPYAFASHFSPEALQAAVQLYRQEFRPSEQLDRPHVIAGVNVCAADTRAGAEEHVAIARRRRVSLLVGRGQEYSDAEADAILASPRARPILQMMEHTAVGAPAEVKDQLDAFAKHADADELIVVHQSPTIDDRLRSAELLAEACLA
jgi:luciferase family oxidoreductase group 1